MNPDKLDFSEDHKRKDEKKHWKQKLYRAEYVKKQKEKDLEEFQKKQREYMKKYRLRKKLGLSRKNVRRNYDNNFSQEYDPKIGSKRFKFRTRDERNKRPSAIFRRALNNGETILKCQIANNPFYEIIHNEDIKFKIKKEKTLYIWYSIFSVFYKNHPFFSFLK